MKLYKLTHDSRRELGYAWASGYGPVHDLWFLHQTSLERKRAFWAVNPQTPGLHIDRGGKLWPDVLGCGNAPPLFFLSERIISSLQAARAPLGRITEIPIAEVAATALKHEAAPRYFVIETVPGIEVDLVATGFKLDAAGKPMLNPPPTPWPSPYKFRANSWNETDLFSYHHFGLTGSPHTELLCSERIFDLAECEGWTNVRFQRIEAI